MTFSLIIPVYNEAPFLRRCLDSIPRTPDFETIIVDDASTDGSQKIIKEYAAGDGIKACLLKKHGGVSVARNYGLMEATGDYIIFLDADDELTPDAAAQFAGAIAEAPRAPVIQMNHYFQKADGMKTVRMFNPKGIYKLDRLPQLWVSSVNKIYKADVIKAKSFPTSCRHGEDEVLNLQVLAEARQIYNSERIALIHHKDNARSLSKSTTPEDLAQEQTELLRFLIIYQDDAELCEAVRQRQVQLWDNPCYRKTFGGRRK